jgi:hypothetical protein
MSAYALNHINALEDTHQLHLDEVTGSRMAVELSFVVVSLVLNILREADDFSVGDFGASEGSARPPD